MKIAKANIAVFTAIVSIALMTTGCTTRLSVRNDNPALSADIQGIISARGISFSNSMDEKIVNESLYSFAYYLKWKYGEDKAAEFLSRLRKGESLTSSAYKVFGKDYYLLGYEILARGIKNDSLYKSGKPKFEDIGPFRVTYFPGSAAERDLELIKYQLLSYYTNLSQIYLSNSENAKRWNSALKAMRDNHIMITLYPSPELGNLKSLGSASVGLSAKKEDKYLIPDLGISTTYYGAVSFTAFTHNLTQIIVGIIHLDELFEKVSIETVLPEGITKENIPAFQNAMNNRFKSLAPRIEKTLNTAMSKGLTEYINTLYNPYYKYGFLEDADSTMRIMIKNGEKLSSIEKLVENGIRSDTPARFLKENQEIHSFLNYLMKTYGWDKVRTLLDTDAKAKDFNTVLGKPLNELSTEWAKIFN